MSIKIEVSCEGFLCTKAKEFFVTSIQDIATKNIELNIEPWVLYKDFFYCDKCWLEQQKLKEKFRNITGGLYAVLAQYDFKTDIVICTANKKLAEDMCEEWTFYHKDLNAYYGCVSHKCIKGVSYKEWVSKHIHGHPNADKFVIEFLEIIE